MEGLVSNCCVGKWYCLSMGNRPQMWRRTNFPFFPLCKQLLEMINGINQVSTRGFKGELSGIVHYKLSLSGIELENNFVVMKRDQTTTCIIKLYTINSMVTTNKDFCNESMKWINNAMHKSTLISGASQKESFKFFNLLTQKVRYLIKRIVSSNGLFNPLILHID